MRGETTASPRADRADGLRQLVGRHVFQQEPTCSGPQCTEGVFIQVEGGQDEHMAQGARSGDDAGGLDPIERGHADIHQYDIGLVELDQPQRGAPVRGLADDGYVVLGFEDHAEALTEERLVISQHDADRHKRAGALQPRSVTATCQPPLGVRTSDQ